MEFHVLLVEDDQVTLKTVEALLRKCSYRVTTAQNGGEAMKVLASCRQSGLKVDLILTDILMPEVTGFDLINEVVHGDVFCDVPVVVMSSQDSQESVLQAFQAGAADYLIKPIRKNELATLWQHVWRANKAKSTGGGSAGQTSVDHDHDHGCAADAKTINDGPHGQIKGSSDGSNGAASSVLQSTVGTTLQPSHAASASGFGREPAPLISANADCPAHQRQPHAPSRGASGPLDSTVDGKPSAGASTLLAAPPAAAIVGGAAAASAGVGGESRAIAFSTSLAVHFDLNPTPAGGAAAAGGSRSGGLTHNGSAAAGKQGQGEGATDAGTAASNATASVACAAAAAAAAAAGTSATVISWSHVEPSKPAGDTDAEGALAAAAEPPRKRRRSKGPAAGGAAGGAGEASQASGSAATGPLGPSAGREGTGTPSGETYAKSPSAFTPASSSTSTVSTSGSGSEAEEETGDAPGLSGRQAGPGAGADTNAAAATAAEEEKEDAGEAPGHCAASGGGRPHAHAHDGGGAARHTATSVGAAGAEPSGDLAAAAAADADGAAAAAATLPLPDAGGHHGLPHPAAAAPGAAHPGEAVALPRGLQELAAIGAQRHQELWTQRALMQQRQQQQAAAAAAAATAVAGAAAVAQQPAGEPSARLDSERVTRGEPADSPAAGPGAAGASGSAGNHAQPSTVAAAGVTTEGGTSTSASGAGTSSLSLLRHSDRSAFTAFTVFLPGRLAAAAAASAAAASSGGAGTGSQSPGAAAASQAPPAYGHPALLSHPHPHPHTQSHIHGHQAMQPPAPPGCTTLLPPVMPLHAGPQPTHAVPAGSRPPDAATQQPPPPPGLPGPLGSAAAAAALAAHMPPYPRPPYGAPGSTPPVYIPEPVLQLIAALSGRAAAEIPVPETVTAAPVIVPKAPSAARLAAVAKYLEKRKHRNFQKKVRYESRKRLAEARPRIRGQFVKASALAAAATPGAAQAPGGGTAATGGGGAAAGRRRHDPDHDDYMDDSDASE